MKICFVQPDTDYQIEKSRHALALTFPQLISDLNLEKSNYVVYIFGKAKIPFEIFLDVEKPSHVFITAITSTFPYAEEIAKLAKEHNCIVVLGGLFASINHKTILKNFLCFDYIISGHPDSTLLSYISNSPSSPKSIVYNTSSNYQKELGNIITDQRFIRYYSKKDTVCYELTNGCFYDCSFCTMRHAFPNQHPCRRSIAVIQNDINQLSNHWKRLKLIDDDISISVDVLRELDLKIFDEVLAETRVDKISEYSMQIFKKAGITHLIVGVETFNMDFLKETNKTTATKEWHNKIFSAIALCQKYNVRMRPVIMITNEYTTIGSLKQLEAHLEGWTPENNIEVLCSFYTPHPGMSTVDNYQRLLTNDLKQFDHLHCVWLPPLIAIQEKELLFESYNRIIDITKSYEYNPVLNLSFEKKEKYDCFFET